jgi:TPR repeat protein
MRGINLIFAFLCAAASSATAQEQTSPLLGDLPQDTRPAVPPTPGDQQTFNQGTAYYDSGDYAHAYQVFYWLAEHDDVAAMRNVGLMKRRGQGTPRDPQGAMEYLKEAADAGLPTAEADLADMYLKGEAGAPDPEAALPWLQAAAKANHPIAQFQLAELYERGQVVPRDVAKAEELYSAAAARGVPHAADRLALLRSGAVSAPRP